MGPVGGAFFNENVDFHWFLKEKAASGGSSLFALFINFSGAPCAEVRADQPGYCESADMET